jgi:hypothetical protein
MSLHLPIPVGIYFASETAHDTDASASCFAADAVVSDEGRTTKGLDAIKAWRIETREKYQHTVEPLSVAERDGKTIVIGKVTGNFPGSPINLQFIFELEGGRISSLRIRP